MTSGQLIDAAKEGKTLLKVRDVIEWTRPIPNTMEVKVEDESWYAHGWFSVYFTQKDILKSIVERPEEWRVKSEVKDPN
jgi:hypothetical protein